jgi:hypothetical protein
MNAVITTCFVVFYIGISGSALAQSQSSPRTPLGPGNRMFPFELLSKRPSGNAIAVVNFGSNPLKFSYWESGNWKPAEVVSGQRMIVNCPDCGRIVYLQFNDGHQDLRVDAKTGDNYAMFWSNSDGRWRFAPLQDAFESGALFQ